ncbi:MAG TPA: right-handed parallel beta-helix repeat-containing protein, partial [Pirellulaceae bacterium]
MPTLSVQAILDTFDLGPGDVIQVTTSSPGFTVALGDSGVTIVGSPGASIIGPITIAGASDVVLQGITTTEPVTLDGGARNTIVASKLLGGVRLIHGSDAQVVSNRIECDGVSVSGAVRPSITDNTISISPIGIAIHTTASTDVVVRGNRIAGTSAGISITAAGGGVISDNDISAAATGVDLQAAFTGSIARNEIHGASVGVRYAAAAALDHNRIHANATGVVASVNNTTSGLGYVLLPGGVEAQPNQIFGNGIGVQLSGTMQAQYVHHNQMGVSGSGSLAVADFGHANRVEANVVGIDVTGSIQFNYVGGNTTGIVAHDRQLIAHNQIYRNTSLGIDISGRTATQVVSNTLYAPIGDLVRVQGGSREVELTNNQFWAESGSAIYVANDSQTGFWSDYNLLHAGDSGKLVHWSGYDFTDILDWQEDVATFDLHSRGRTVVNPGWSEPRFVDAAVDDFRTLDLASVQRSSNPAIDGGDPRTDLGITPATPTNLLSNSSFASGLSGWTTNAGAGTGSTNPLSFDESPSFRPGSVPLGFAEQTIDLTANGFNTSQLDSSDLVVVFGGRIRTAAEAIRDS